MDDFKSKAEKMQAETAKLVQAAKTGDAAALKAQVGETGKACKACHDNYRNK
jgi:cytochrome c556